MNCYCPVSFVSHAVTFLEFLECVSILLRSRPGNLPVQSMCEFLFYRLVPPLQRNSSTATVRLIIWSLCRF